MAGVGEIHEKEKFLPGQGKKDLWIVTGIRAPCSERITCARANLVRSIRGEAGSCSAASVASHASRNLSPDMPQCETCGNEYDKAMQVTVAGKSHWFDSFECAIHALAPACAHCGCKVIGHGAEAEGKFFCCAHCAKQEGVRGLDDGTRSDWPRRGMEFGLVSGEKRVRE